MKRIFVFIIGMLTALFLLETGLRLGSYIYQRKRHCPAQSAVEKSGMKYVILCLGNSYTMGVGAPHDMSYPAQLQRLFDHKVGGKNVIVINAGVGAQNTAELLADLTNNINTFHPQLVILQTGQPNSWNYLNYADYLRRDHYARSYMKWFRNNLYDVCYKSSVFRLIKLLVYNHDHLHVDTVAPLAHLLPKCSFAFFPNEFSGRMTVAGLVKVLQSRGVGVEDGIGIKGINEVVLTDKELYKRFADVPRTPKDLNRIEQIDTLDSMNLQKFNRSLIERGNPQECPKCSRDRQNAVIDGHIDVKELEKAESVIQDIYFRDNNVVTNPLQIKEARHTYMKLILLSPESSRNYSYVGMLYYAEHNYGEAAKWYSRSLRLALKYRARYEIMEAYKHFRDMRVTDKGPRNDAINKKIDEFIRQCKYKTPDQSFNYVNLDDRMIRRWISSDVKEIVRILHKNKIAVIIQNYPKDFSCNSLLLNISRKFQLPFIDNYAVFQERMAHGLVEQDLFVPDAHCNARGYGLMAENVFNKIIAEDLLKVTKGQ